MGMPQLETKLFSCSLSLILVTNDITFKVVTYECKTTQGQKYFHIRFVTLAGIWVDAPIIAAKKFCFQPIQFRVRSRNLALRAAVT
jgi:hypothetical protein